MFNPDKFVSDLADSYNTYSGENKPGRHNRFRIRYLKGHINSHQTNRQNKNDGKDEPSTEGATPSTAVGLSNVDTAVPLKWKIHQIGLPSDSGNIDNLSLTKEIIDVYQEIMRWEKSEKWFKKRKIPWKRGFLLYGIPGTGKTAFVRALGQDLGFPIFIFDLSSMTNSDFSDNWDSCASYAPCIALFEDIDGIFHGRKNVANEGTMQKGLTFDCFLNVIDGVNNTDGVLKIITTNDISNIDPALGINANGDGMSTRPGRIDRVVEFKPLDEDGKKKMAKRIFEGFEEKQWIHIFDHAGKDTGAQFQERCCRLALDLFWSDQNKRESNS